MEKENALSTSGVSMRSYQLSEERYIFTASKTEGDTCAKLYGVAAELRAG